MFKKIILPSLVALALIASASQPVQALTADEVQAQIRQLLAKVAELTQQLNALRGSGTTVTTWQPQDTPGFPGIARRICSISLRPFYTGEENDQVRAFQEFLQTEGFLGVQPTGYFGDLTRQALARWQAAQGFEAAGTIGPRTLERIRAWCGSHGNTGNDFFKATPTRGNAPLAVTFSSMVGGFHPANISYKIDFGDNTNAPANECSAPADACTSPGTNTHTYSANGMYMATLNKVTDPCPDDGDPNTPRCLAAIHSEVIGRVQIIVGPVACTLEYAPVCGSKQVTCVTTPCNPVQQTYGNRCAMNADGATFVHAGECRSTTNPADNPQCKRWSNAGWCSGGCTRSTPGGNPSCYMPECALPAGGVSSSDLSKPAQCLEYFNTSDNRAPTISSFSGPTTLALNTNGTWTIAASDPENGQLSYQIRWGDENTVNDLLMSLAGLESNFVQTTSFTHAYATAGIRTVQITVRDSAGKEAKASTTVRVGNVEISDGIACPADAHQCPNGQWVGRSGSNCTFQCPTSTVDFNTAEVAGTSCKVGSTTYSEGQTYTVTMCGGNTKVGYEGCNAGPYRCVGGRWLLSE